MATLRVGRIGLETEQLDLVERVRHAAGRGSLPVYEFSGVIVIPDLTTAIFLRNQLLSQFDLYGGDVWSAVPIIWGADSTMDGFYRLINVTVQSEKIHSAARKLPFSMTVERLGGYNQTMLQSLLSTADIDSDHGTDGKPWHSPAAGADAYSTGGAFPDLHTRTTEDGVIQVSIDLPQNAADPTWSIEPSDYYNGAVRMHVDNQLIAGFDCQPTDTNWVMSNGLMRVRASAFGGASDGVIEVAWFNGTTWSSWFRFHLVFIDQHIVPAWNYFNIIDNRPEVCAVRLQRDAAELNETTAMHTLELTLRRGAPMVMGRYHFDKYGGTHAIEATDGGAWTRNAGASFATRDTLHDGHRVCMGCPKAFTLNVDRLTLDVGAFNLPFWVGAAIDNALNGSFDGPADLTQQYLGWTSEAVQAIRR